MNKMKISATLSLLVAVLLPMRAGAAPTVAFGYLVNKSQDPNYEYLETIFPNSFASSLNNIFRAAMINPGQADAILQKQKMRLEKQYQPHELRDLTEKLESDYFIYGDFLVIPGDRIKITINLYCHDLNTIFSFTNAGRMEAEIFKLVDRIAAIMLDFLEKDNFYMARVVPKGSKIGIFTNLQGRDLNYLYCAFLKGGYRVASIQANYLYNNLTSGIIENFRTVSAAESSYEIISDPRAVKLLQGSRTGARSNEEITAIQNMHRKYDIKYADTKLNSMQKLIGHHAIDKILIIGFNVIKTKAWVRCLDLKTRDLILMESNISGSIPSICDKIITRMSTEINQK
jgi:TolB-like protein